MKFNTLYYDNALFDIDATYVIHLLNNGRFESMYQQLNTYKPSEKVYILENSGYKTKPHIKQEPAYDLIHCFKYIFNDAKEKHYKTILILEDDFFFSDDIYDENLRQIEKVVKQSKGPILYHLGTLPLLRFQSYLFFSGGAHSILYNEHAIDKMLDKLDYYVHDYDLFINRYFIFQRYLTKKPLCYQLFPETENQKQWYNLFYLTSLFKLLIKFLKLDKQIQPGYGFFYFMSQLLFIVLIFILIVLIHYLFSLF